MSAFDVDAFLQRFADRAKAVSKRGVPPLEGEARRSYMAAAQQDFVDYSLVADASWEIDGSALVLRIPLASTD